MMRLKLPFSPRSSANRNECRAAKAMHSLLVPECFRTSPLEKTMVIVNIKSGAKCGHYLGDYLTLLRLFQINFDIFTTLIYQFHTVFITKVITATTRLIIESNPKKPAIYLIIFIKKMSRFT